MPVTNYGINKSILTSFWLFKNRTLISFSFLWNPIPISEIMTKHLLLILALLICNLFCHTDMASGVINDSILPKFNEQAYILIVDTTISDQICPLKGKVISHFGYRGRHKHTGTDIKLQKGDTVRAALCGKVTKASSYFGYGNLVTIKHLNNIETYYSHLSKCLVSEGDSVRTGDIVGLGGRTGRASTNHLHFEVRVNKKPQNAENYFDFSSNTIKKSLLSKAPELLDRNIKSDDKITGKKIATDGFVIIHQGDTLYDLARRNGTTVKNLMELNDLQGSKLKIGQKLKIQ